MKVSKIITEGKMFSLMFYQIRSTNSLREYIEMSLENISLDIGTNLRFMEEKTDKFSLEGKFCSLYLNSSSNGLTFQNNEVPRTILTHCKHLSVYFKRKVITLEIFFFLLQFSSIYRRQCTYLWRSGTLINYNNLFIHNFPQWDFRLSSQVKQNILASLVKILTGP